jgi:hypothetical protein
MTNFVRLDIMRSVKKLYPEDHKLRTVALIKLPQENNMILVTSDAESRQAFQDNNLYSR